MATNPSTSNSNIPTWMNESWHMTPISGNITSNSITPNVIFDTSNLTISIHGAIWGTLDSSSVTAAASSSAAVTMITGSTIFGQPFQIYHTDRMLKCYMRNTISQRSWPVVGLGVITGTLLGGVTGFAAGSPLLGAAAGLIAATTSSLVTARGLPAGGSYHPLQGGGSTPTWVASDPGSGIAGKPGPQAVPPVRTTA